MDNSLCGFKMEDSADWLLAYAEQYWKSYSDMVNMNVSWEKRKKKKQTTDSANPFSAQAQQMSLVHCSRCHQNQTFIDVQIHHDFGILQNKKERLSEGIAQEKL